MSDTTNIKADDRHWVLIRCCGLFTHYRPVSDSTVLVSTRSGGYDGRGRIIQPGDFLQAAPRDEVTIRDSVLMYGIDPAATFTHSHPEGRRGSSAVSWPRTFAPTNSTALRDLLLAGAMRSFGPGAAPCRPAYAGTTARCGPIPPLRLGDTPREWLGQLVSP